MTKQAAQIGQKQCKECKFKNDKLSKPSHNQKTGVIENTKGFTFCELINDFVTDFEPCPLTKSEVLKRPAKAPSKLNKYEVICNRCKNVLINFFAEKTNKPENEIEFAGMSPTEHLLAYRKNSKGQMELHCACRGPDSIGNLKKYGDKLTVKGKLYKIRLAKGEKGRTIQRSLIK